MKSLCKKLTRDVQIAIVTIADIATSSSKPDELGDVNTLKCSVGYVSIKMKIIDDFKIVIVTFVVYSGSDNSVRNS